jgi:hypothetical protein
VRLRFQVFPVPLKKKEEEEEEGRRTGRGGEEERSSTNCFHYKLYEFMCSLLLLHMYAPLYHNDFPAELPPFIIVSIKPKVSVSF